MKIEILGVDETIKGLKKISWQKQEQLDKIVKNSAKSIQKKARANVNVRTGNLRKSIKPKYFFKEGPAATVFPRGGKGRHRHFLEYGTKKMAKRPFMKPATDTERPIYMGQVKKVVDEDHVV